MAIAGILPGTAGANLLREKWAGEIYLRPNENRYLAKHVTEPMGATKMGEILHMRILPVIATNTLGTSSEANASALTFHTSTIDEVTATPTFHYAAVNLPMTLTFKLDDGDQAATIAGYRKQGMAALWSAIEVLLAQEATGIATQLGPSNITESLFLQAKGLQRTNAKEYADAYDGNPAMHFCYDVSQIQHVEAIAALMHADIRGDRSNPVVDGPLQKGLGFTFRPSGNIYKAAGVAYNMLFSPLAFALGFNEKPMPLAPQPDGASVNYFFVAEAGAQELLDECCVVIRSAV
jgi:hypothetical protein